MTWDKHVVPMLREAVAAVEPAADSEQSRTSVLEAIDAALAEKPPPARRPFPWQAAAAFVLAGVVTASAVAWWPRPEATARVVEQRGETTVDGERAFRTGRGALTLALPHGGTLFVGANSDVELRDEATRVLLRTGSIAAAVVAAEQHGLTVETMDTQVFTRGARVTVRSAAGCDGRSQVIVSDGAVLVRSRGEERAVVTGQTWPVCEPARQPREAGTDATIERVVPPEPAVDAPVPPRRAAPPPAEVRLERPRREPESAPAPEAPTPGTLNAPPAPEPPTLSALNARYANALALQRAGAFDDALAELDAVLTVDSPLAETALAQKLRWLAPSRPTDARAAAREYLKRFPMGPARAEAETLLLDSP